MADEEDIIKREAGVSCALLLAVYRRVQKGGGISKLL
jgi:hypothetical protein